MPKKRVFAVSGSVRKNSSNEKILQAIAGWYRETLDLTIYDEIDQLPHFNPDHSDGTTHPAVIRFRELIRNADGVLICTPEYVFSLPGTLKNALEWTVSTTVFTDKPSAFIVASGLGEKTFESLDLILQTLIQKPVPPKSKLLIQGARSKIGATGTLSDDKTVDEIKGVVESLISTMEKS